MCNLSKNRLSEKCDDLMQFKKILFEIGIFRKMELYLIIGTNAILQFCVLFLLCS